MQLKFKIQPYQTDAAKAVTDVLAGQRNNGASLYLRDLGRMQTRDHGPASLFAYRSMC